jgi:dTDP-4-dehydrorhamnose 3,5-epimerase
VRSTGSETELGVVPEGVQDAPSVDAESSSVQRIEGVEIARLAPHVDHRGSLVEVVNFAHSFWDEDVVYAYCIMIRPGRIKGWGMHKRQSDRYFLVSGSVRVVLYDGRDESSTAGSFEIHNLTREAPSLLLIPAGVWHADQNWGDGDAFIMNFPTRPYEPADPDKYRIDPHSGEIPFDWSLRDG